MFEIQILDPFWTEHLYNEDFYFCLKYCSIMIFNGYIREDKIRILDEYGKVLI